MASITGLDSLFNLGSTIIDKLFPDKNEAAKAKIRLIELQQAGEFKQIDAELQMMQAQTDVNKVEAASDSLFVSGWRPGVGWVCVAAMACNYIGVPMLAWASSIWGIPVPQRLELGEIMPLLLGMLGLGAMRTSEKNTITKAK